MRSNSVPADGENRTFHLRNGERVDGFEGYEVHIYSVTTVEHRWGDSRMSNKMGRLRCRKIGAADLEAIADLLAVGFPRRNRTYWVRALNLLSKRIPPEGFPQYGYMLENGTVAVGVILLISYRAHGSASIRCNGSSWYVIPEFRSYATLLLAQALKVPATHTDISPSTHTVPIIEALGYKRYCEGAYAAIPALSLGRRGSARVIQIARSKVHYRSVPPCELDLLREHARYGCISLWCEGEEGGSPFIFRRRFVKNLPFVPAAQLIYSADLDELVRFARPIGIHLAKRGMPYIIAPANAAVPGIPGRFFSGKPMYYKGSDRPSLTDLAYTEAALFGI